MVVRLDRTESKQKFLVRVFDFLINGEIVNEMCENAGSVVAITSLFHFCYGASVLCFH